MVISPLLHNTIVNKNIVYSDTVLPLKDLGKNLTITTINDIDEDSLENCLKSILEENQAVLFNTIQYSKQKKKIYFYTDKPISSNNWEESKYRKYQHLDYNIELLGEIKKIFYSKKINNPEYISLYDIAKLMKMKNKEYEEMQDSYEDLLEQKINDQYYDSSLYISSFNYKTNELKIRFKYIKKYEDIYFSKSNNDLYITKSTTYMDKEILSLLGDIISNLYDEFLKYKDYEEQNAYSINPVNSKFLVNINKYGVSIYTKNPTSFITKDFELSSHSYKQKYDYDCNSNNIVSTIKGNEDELFKRIFVRIEDCPEWSKKILYQIRKEQLTEEERIAEEQAKQREKKQKRLKLKRKIINLIK